MNTTTQRDLARFQQRQLKETRTVVRTAALVPVEVIHDEFFSAGEELGKESEALLEKCKEILQNDNEDILLKVSDLGFIQAKNIKGKADAIINRRKAQQHLIYLSEYERVYPFNRFITKDAVEAICKKYNLYVCDAEKFIGEIPVKNQMDIAKFQVYEEDVPTALLPGWRNGLGGFISSGAWTLSWGEDEPTIKVPELVEHKAGLGNQRAGCSLEVIAPLKEINTKGMQIRDRRVMTKDPIVLQPVKGGYLIITAWGAEANDVEVQNPKMN